MSWICPEITGFSRLTQLPDEPAEHEAGSDPAPKWKEDLSRTQLRPLVERRGETEGRERDRGEEKAIRPRATSHCGAWLM
jgi:hypothetical protein